jgi:hypothetical protein
VITPFDYGVASVMTHFEITRDEYEQRRDAFELCRWVNAQFRAMEETGHFDEIYFERKGLNVPRFVAEAVPVSRLALLLATPGIEVHVTCFAHSLNYDAQIEISGWRQPSFRVEVTTTEPDDVVLRRQALSRVGHVMLAGPIRREGRKIIAEAEMVDVTEEEQRRTALMLARLRDKVESGRYDANTAFLVYSTDLFRIGVHARADLVGDAERYLAQAGVPTAGVYFAFQTDYTVMHVPGTGESQRR